MASFDKDKVKMNIDELIQATKSGAINWVLLNPTTYLWETSAPKSARVTVQAATRPIPVRTPAGAGIRQVKHYILQVLESTPPVQKTRLLLNGAEDDEINEQIGELYTVIEIKLSEESLGFLKSIIPPKNTQSS